MGCFTPVKLAEKNFVAMGDAVLKSTASSICNQQICLCIQAVWPEPLVFTSCLWSPNSKQYNWSDYAEALADFRICWLLVTMSFCWTSHMMAHLVLDCVHTWDLLPINLMPIKLMHRVDLHQTGFTPGPTWSGLIWSTSNFFHTLRVSMIRIILKHEHDLIQIDL